jgi:hypothetical protein
MYCRTRSKSVLCRRGERPSVSKRIIASGHAIFGRTTRTSTQPTEGSKGRTINSSYPRTSPQPAEGRKIGTGSLLLLACLRRRHSPAPLRMNHICTCTRAFVRRDLSNRCELTGIVPRRSRCSARQTDRWVGMADFDAFLASFVGLSVCVAAWCTQGSLLTCTQPLQLFEKNRSIIRLYWHLE